MNERTHTHLFKVV